MELVWRKIWKEFANDDRNYVPKMLDFLPFTGRVENKKCCGSQRLFNIFKNVLHTRNYLFGFYKDMTGVAAQIILRFPDGKWFALKKSTHRISLELFHRFSSFHNHAFGKIMRHPTTEN